MKDVYMDVMDQYGHIPKDFSLGDYLIKKKQEEYEWEEYEKNMQSKKKDGIDEPGQNGSSEQGNGENKANAWEENK